VFELFTSSHGSQILYSLDQVLQINYSGEHIKVTTNLSKK